MRARVWEAVCVWGEVGSSEGPKWENLSIAAVAADVLEWPLLWSSDRKGKFRHSFISFSIARLGCVEFDLYYFYFFKRLFCPSLSFAL